MVKRMGWLLLVLVFSLPFLLWAKEPKPLTVYTYSSFPVPIMKQIQKHFQKTHGRKVVFKSFSDTGPLFNQLLRERKDPVADVMIGLDNNYFLKTVKAGLFEAYRPSQAGKIRSELIFDPKFRMTPFDYGYIVFNYDQTKLDRIPKTHRDLLDPYYKGKIIIENPLTSSPGQVFLLTTIALYGENGYLDYWRALKKNLLTIAPGWDEAYGMYTSGEAPMVLSYGTSPAYHLLYDKTEKYQALVLDGAAYAQIEGAGIVKGTKNRKGAEQLIEYLLSPELQRLIPENQFMYPARTALTLPPSFRIAAKAHRLLNLPVDKVGANLDKWLAEWEKVMN
jgi:thiamine transport system substrate-binding protein